MKKIIVISIVVLVVISTLGMGQSIVNQIGTLASDSYRVRNGPTDASDLFVVRGNTGNIGMGITSPLVRFHVYGAGVQRIRIQSSDNQAGIEVDGNSADGKWVIYNPQNSSQLRFHVLSTASGNGPRMTILANGRVGIGTTSPVTHVDINSSNMSEGIALDGKKALGGFSANSLLRLNPTGDFTTGVFIEHQPLWVPAGLRVGPWSPGSVSNNELIVDGRVGIGNTAPESKLHVFNGSGGYTGSPATDAVVYLESNVNAYVAFNPGTTHWSGLIFTDGGNTKRAALFYSNFYHSLSFKTGGVNDRMTIAENGNIGIGDATPDYKLDVAGPANLNDGKTGIFLRASNKEAAYYNTTTGHFSWGFDGTHNYFAKPIECGYTGAGPTAQLVVTENADTDYIAKFENTNKGTNADGIRIELGPNDKPGVANYYIGFFDGDGHNEGEVRGTGSGGIAYVNTSDARLKNDLGGTIDGLKVVSQMIVRKFEFKETPGYENIGFFAQELQKVYPYAAFGDPTANVEEEPMGIDYGKLTPILVKAIQELQAEIEILKNR